MSAAQAPGPVSATAELVGVTREYEGLYTVAADEDRFVPCGVPGIGDGWALKFRNPQQAIFIGHRTVVQPYAPLSHFIRVRGSLDSPGRYNRGFQVGQLAVDTILSVDEMPRACSTYQDLPRRWDAVGKVRIGMRSAAFSPDWRLAAIVDDSGSLSIRDVGTGMTLEKLGQVEIVEPEVLYKAPMVFSADSKLLFVGSSDAIVRVFDLASGKLLYALGRAETVPGSNDINSKWTLAIRDLSLDKRGTMLAVVNGQSARIWSLQTREPITEFKRGPGFMMAAFFLSDGSLIVGGDTIVTSYREPGGKAQWSAKTGTRFSQNAAHSSNGEWLALNVWSDSLALWSIREQAPGPKLKIPTPAGGVGAVAFSSDGKLLAKSAGMYGLYFWRLGSGNPVRSFHGYPGPVYSAWFLPDGNSVVTYSLYDTVFRVVNVDEPPNITKPVTWVDSSAVQLAYRPGGPRTIGGIVMGPNQRAVPSADVELFNGDEPGVVVQRGVTSPGGYVSFNSVRFPHVMIRVRKPGFQEGLLYIHQRRFDPGPFAMELKPGN